MSRFAWIPGALFIVAVPIFLITASVAWAFNDTGLYQRGFQKYRVAAASGISDAGLRQVAAGLRGYFNSRQEPLAITARVFGVERELFNQREVLHMRDVKRLVWRVYGLAVASALYLIAGSAAGFVSRGRCFFATLAGGFLWGGGLTMVLVLAVGLFALAGFDTLFLRFHQLSFSNDLWQLDPRRDYLLILFPQGFWFDATLRVAASAVAGAVLIVLTSGGYLMYRRWLDRKQTGEALEALREATEG